MIVASDERMVARLLSVIVDALVVATLKILVPEKLEPSAESHATKR